MRNLLVRFTLWLARVLDINLIDRTRILNGADAVARGSRWETFYREQGGLADMLADIRREAFETASEIDPRDHKLIAYWAMADRNARKLIQRIESVIHSGKIEAERIRAAERAEAARIVRSI